LFGNNYDEAAAEAKRLRQEEGMVLCIHLMIRKSLRGKGRLDWRFRKRVYGGVLMLFSSVVAEADCWRVSLLVKRVRPNVKLVQKQPMLLG